MKRVIALILALVMVFGMSTVSFAKVASPQKRRSSGGSSTAVVAVANKNADTGTWTKTDAGWTFSGAKNYKNAWGFINNPYTKSADQGGWYFFDANGVMLTGWQFINGKWYYLNATSNGDLGKCYINTITPDGYKVDETGAWIQ